jgi:hypothetical protein
MTFKEYLIQESTLNKRQLAATKHPDKLGEGAKKRKHVKPEEKMGVVMHEFKHGTLNSSSGQKVTDRSQAIAIGLSEKRRAEQGKYK